MGEEEVWIEMLYEKREALQEEVEKSARTLKEVEDEMKKTKKEAEVLKAKLIRVEVARERGEVEAKKLVEQKDKWERLAKKTKEEKEELENNLRQQLREVKLAAKWAPTTTTATQTQQTPPLQRNSACQMEKPTSRTEGKGKDGRVRINSSGFSITR